MLGVRLQPQNDDGAGVCTVSDPLTPTHPGTLKASLGDDLEGFANAPQSFLVPAPLQGRGFDAQHEGAVLVGRGTHDGARAVGDPVADQN